MKKLLQKLDFKIVSKLEKIPAPPWLIPLFIGMLSLLRIEFEYSVMCTTCRKISLLYYEGVCSFLFSFLAGASIIYYLSLQKKLNVLRLSSIGFIIILLAPLLDGLIFGRTIIYKYAYKQGYEGFYPVYKLLFSFSNDAVAGVGLKIEIWLVSFLASFYIFIKTRRLLRFLLAIPLILGVFVFVAYQQIITHFIAQDFLIDIINFQRMGFFGLDHYFIFLWGLYSVIILSIFTLREIKKNKNKNFYFIFLFFLFLIISFVITIIKNKQGVSLSSLYHLRTITGFTSIFALAFIDFEEKNIEKFSLVCLTIIAISQMPGIDGFRIFLLTLSFILVILYRIFRIELPTITMPLSTGLVFLFWILENILFGLEYI